MINVACIGVSGFAEWHYRDLIELAKRGDVNLCAVTIINQGEEKEKCQVLRSMGCEVFEDYREMLDLWKGRIDLCVIPTPIHLHARMTLAALDAGCNVLVEKPAAGTIAEVDAMMRAEQEANRFVAVAFQHMYTPQIMKMKQALVNRLIGSLEVIKCRGLWPRADSYYRRNDWAGRIRNSEGLVFDAPFNNAFAHWLNLLLFFAAPNLLESADPRFINAELYHVRDIESACTGCMHIETREGIPLFLWVTHSCEKDCDPVLEVQGSGGSLTVTPKGIVHASRDGIKQIWPDFDFMEVRGAMWKSIIRRTVTGDGFVCGLDVARKQTLCANTAFQSSQVNNIAGKYLRQNAAHPEPFVVIKGIEENCDAAFREKKLWSELGLPWAVPGRKIVFEEDLVLKKT